MKFNQITYHGYNESTSLCELGLKYGADKSPLVAHGYTPFYNFLFSNLRYKDINFGEIGIYENASMKMWREYFPSANLYGWDCRIEDRLEDLNRFYKKDYVQNAKQHNLKNTVYDYMNVSSEDSINNALEKTQIKFDVLVDDSDHQFWSQIKLLRNVYKFLKPGGIFIIEDLTYNFVDILEEFKVYGHDQYYESITKIDLYDEHLKYKQSPYYMLMLIKK